MGNIKKSKRIFYFDALRALAIISVMMIHIFTSMKALSVGDFATIPSLKWLITDFSLTFFRIGVLLFLMLSGALSLGRDWDIKSFLGKRIPRIVLPYLFWGFILSLVVIACAFVLGFPWFDSTLNIQNVLVFIFNTYIYCNNHTFAPYWFFWMILGTYLIMPIFNKWLLHSELTEAEYFLCFWLITCIFDFTLFTKFPIKLTYFTSPIGLVVLGYYLRHTERKLLNNPYFSIFLILISTIAMMAISYHYSDTSHIHIFDRYCIFNAIEVIGIFTLFKNFSKLRIKPNFIYNPDGIFRKFVFALAKYSYGIYLIHNTIKSILIGLINHSQGFYISTLILIVGTLFISLIILALLNRIPYINQMIGAK